MDVAEENASAGHPMSRRGFLIRTAAAGGGAALAGGAAAPGTARAVAQEEKAVLKVAACQVLNRGTLEENLEKISGYIRKAAADGVDVISFPEAALTGYVAEKAHYEALGADRIAAAECAVAELSKSLDIAVVLGTVHWEDGKLYNSLLAIDKGGVMRGRYSKTYLAEKWPEPGQNLPVYMLAGIPSCFIVCHDVRYPELVRLPVMAGAQVCYFCSHESGMTAEHKYSAYRAMPISRATENTIYVVMVNSAADPKTNEGSHGNSKIIDPDGNVMEEMGHYMEGLVCADIDLAKATRWVANNALEQPSHLSLWLKKGLGHVTVADEVRAAVHAERKGTPP